jgi:imidazolonepropionase-like amidohydrolase
MLGALLLPLVAFTAGQREVNTIPPPPAGPPLAIVGARLIDGHGGRPIEDAAVVVRGDRIIASGARAQVAIPPDAVRIEAAGLTVLPGLVDAHLHTRNPGPTARPFLLNGVTTFRDPGHPFAFYETLPTETDPLPRVFLTGSHLDGHPPIWPEQARVVTDPADARRAVNENVARGASAIKTYFRLPLESIHAACEAAAGHGLLVTAHLELVDADAAIEVGVRGIEHLTSFGTVLASPEVAHRFRSLVADNPRARTLERFNLWAAVNLDDGSRVRPLLDLLVRKQVVVCPTLNIFEFRPGDPNATENHVRAFRNLLQFAGMCHRAGVRFAVGSHTNAPHARRGWAYHRELELLVEAGFTPIEALHAATMGTARFLGTEDRLGSIEPGKLADLVLVAGDPAEDIRAMYDVRAVLLGGYWVRRLE